MRLFKASLEGLNSEVLVLTYLLGMLSEVSSTLFLWV